MTFIGWAKGNILHNGCGRTASSTSDLRFHPTFSDAAPTWVTVLGSISQARKIRMGRATQKGVTSGSINSALPRHWRVIFCHQKENGTGRKRQWTATAVTLLYSEQSNLVTSWASFKKPTQWDDVTSFLTLTYEARVLGRRNENRKNGSA